MATVADAAIDDEPADEADFVLDTSAPLARGRLVVPHAKAVEQARIDSMLIDHQRCVLQALVVSVFA
jgi:hypothetical protein